MGHTRRCTTVGSGGRQGRLPSDHGRAGGTSGFRTQDGDDRRNLFEAHRTASSLAVKKGGAGRLIGRTKGGMNTKLHAVTDASGRPISFFMTAGQVSDYIGAAALLNELPKAQWLLADRGYDADWFRDALQKKGITPCIPGRKSRNKTVKYDKRRYKRRNRIEIMFGRLKGLAAGRNPLRQVPQRLLLRHPPRCHRHLLALINES